MLEGGCLCGAVCYQIEGLDLPLSAMEGAAEGSGSPANVSVKANPESLGRWVCKQLDEEHRQEEQSGSKPIPADISKRL
jgi:hypothetical protein